MNEDKRAREELARAKLAALEKSNLPKCFGDWSIPAVRECDTCSAYTACVIAVRGNATKAILESLVVQGVETKAVLGALAKGDTQVSDGSTASYYELPEGAAELQDLIAFRDMNAQMGEIFRACYRYGQVAHSPKVRDIKKIIFYAQAELSRLEKYGEK